MKLIIAGSRHLIVSEDFLAYFIATKFPTLTEVVSGRALGIDTCGYKFAERFKIPVKSFMPEYGKYPGKIAPLMRNTAMAKYADWLLLIWDGFSRGSFHMKKEMLKEGKAVVEIIIKEGRPYNSFFNVREILP